jgi:pimeloyl-ACP methyl ester carboxylesterase
MGSLVAIELAKRYPLLVKGLVLCAPPIYRLKEEVEGIIPSTEQILRKIYDMTAKDALKRPDFYIGLSKTAALAMPPTSAFSITNETVASYVAALRASIINQSTYTDVQDVHVPTRIIYGKLDPFVVKKNLKQLAKSSEHIETTSVMASHEISKAYLQPIVESVDAILKR